MQLTNSTDQLLARAARDVDDGVLPACQLAVGHDGELVASATFGKASDDTRFLMWSCTKAVTGGAVWRLVSEGALDFEAPVADYLPGFGSNGKEGVRVEHLLMHTAGFPYAPLGNREARTSEGRRAAFERWRLNWPTHTRYEYHPLAAHWVLAELVETAAKDDYRAYIRDSILEPLGLHRLRLGVPPEEQGDIADGVLVGAQPGPADQMAESLNDPRSRALGIPGGGAVSTAADLALYYQALLHNPAGLWSSEVLADVTGTIRNTFPDVPRDGISANRSRGLVIKGDDGFGARRMHFGETTSPRTFGHDGAFGQIAWADPDTGISFAYLTNGLDRDNPRMDRRNLDLSNLAGSLAL